MNGALGLITKYGASKITGGGGACNAYGVLSTTGGSDIKTSGQAGWSFTLDAPKTMCGFRYYYRAGGHISPTLRLWRVGDAQLIAEHVVGVAGTPDAWNEYDITPVNLAASTLYMVTAAKITPGSDLRRWAVSNYTLAPGVNYDVSWRDSNPSAMPVTDRPSETWMLYADFRFQS